MGRHLLALVVLSLLGCRDSSSGGQAAAVTSATSSANSNTAEVTAVPTSKLFEYVPDDASYVMTVSVDGLPWLLELAGMSQDVERLRASGLDSALDNLVGRGAALVICGPGVDAQRVAVAYEKMVSLLHEGTGITSEALTSLRARDLAALPPSAMRQRTIIPLRAPASADALIAAARKWYPGREVIRSDDGSLPDAAKEKLAAGGVVIARVVGSVLLLDNLERHPFWSGAISAGAIPAELRARDPKAAPSWISTDCAVTKPSTMKLCADASRAHAFQLAAFQGQTLSIILPRSIDEKVRLELFRYNVDWLRNFAKLSEDGLYVKRLLATALVAEEDITLSLRWSLAEQGAAYVRAALNSPVETPGDWQALVQSAFIPLQNALPNPGAGTEVAIDLPEVFLNGINLRRWEPATFATTMATWLDLLATEGSRRELEKPLKNSIRVKSLRMAPDNGGVELSIRL